MVVDVDDDGSQKDGDHRNVGCWIPTTEGGCHEEGPCRPLARCEWFDDGCIVGGRRVSSSHGRPIGSNTVGSGRGKDVREDRSADIVDDDVVKEETALPKDRRVFP